jgi:hypothetical protein
VNEETLEVAGTDTGWIYASGVTGLNRAEIPLQDPGAAPQSYEVRLYFSAPADDQAGQRVFDVKLQGQTVASALDITAKAGAVNTAHVETFAGILVSEKLLLELVPTQANGPLPVLNGIEVLRTGEKEIRVGMTTR